MKPLALWAIRAYQRYLSPHKGFVCAYRQHTGRASCSAFGYRCIRWHGIWFGWLILRRRLQRCGEIHRQCITRKPALLFKQQAGFCDASCDLPCDGGCDTDHCGSGRGLGNSGCYDCACDSCDWPSREKQRPKKKKPTVK